MGTITQRFDGDGSGLEKEFRKMQRELAKLAEENKKLKQASQEASDAASKGAKEQTDGMRGVSGAIGNAATGLVSLVAGYLSVSNAIALVNEELERQKRLGQEAADVQSRIASAQAGFAINLQGLPREEQQRIIAGVQRLDVETGFGDQAALLRAASNLQSATGDANLSLNILREVAQVTRLNPSDLEPTAAAVGDIATIIGDETGKESLGLALRTQAAARITSLEGFRNLSTGIAGASAFDTSEDRTRAAVEAASFEAALGRGMKDATGAQTSTAAIALAQQLERLLPEEDVLDARGRVVRKGTGLETLAQRIEAVQGDETLQRQFFMGDARSGLAAASFEKASLGSVRQLLTDSDSRIAQEFRANLESITPDPAAVDDLKRTLADLTPQIEAANQQAAVRSAVQGYQAETPEGLRASVREQARLALESTDASFTDALATKGMLTFFDLGLSDDNPATAAQEMVTARRESLLLDTEEYEAGFGKRLRDRGELDPSERARLDVYDEAIRKLGEAADTYRRMLEAQGAGGARAAAADVGRHSPLP